MPSPLADSFRKPIAISALGLLACYLLSDWCNSKPPLTGDALVNWAAGDVLLLSASERREAFEFALRQTFEARRANAGKTRAGKEDKKLQKSSVLSLDSFFFPLALAPVCNVQTNYSCVISRESISVVCN